MKSQVICILLLLLEVAGIAQTKGTATLSGRITVENQALPGIEVILVPSSNTTTPFGGANQVQPLSATTDAEGRYKLINIPAGSYRIGAYAPTHVIQGEAGRHNPGKTVNISEGDTVENIDFAMTRGGVVTGKVTDGEGRPIIAINVLLIRIDENGKRIGDDESFFSQWQTDDRGVYRMFGLLPGRYKIAAGDSTEGGMPMMVGGVGGYYRRAFHPDVADEQKAKVVEVSAGQEAEGVDIKLTRAGKGYSASGRVIDAETGKPVSGVLVAYGMKNKEGFRVTAVSGGSNSRGEFKLEGLGQGSYGAYAVSAPQESSLYSDPVNFDVTNGDVSGLEIAVRRGAGISGVAIVEGTKDPAVSAKLSSVQVTAHNRSGEQQYAVSFGQNFVNPDGSFKLTGLRPGKTQLYAHSYERNGPSFLRAEHNGAEVKEFDVNPGDQITGVRLIFAYGNGLIAGRVEIKNGSLPAGTKLYVALMRDSGAADGMRYAGGAEIDDRGFFLIEGLPQGHYKLTISGRTPGAQTQLKIPKVEQPVSIAGNSKQEVTLILDLSQPVKEGDR